MGTGLSDAERAAGRMTHVACWSTEEGRPVAELVVSCAARHGIPLEARTAHKERVNDDDGMFVNAGFRAAVMNIGSWPNADAEYHLPGDVPERVDVENVARSAMLVLAAALELAG